MRKISEFCSNNTFDISYLYLIELKIIDSSVNQVLAELCQKNMSVDIADINRVISRIEKRVDYMQKMSSRFIFRYESILARVALARFMVAHRVKNNQRVR